MADVQERWIAAMKRAKQLGERLNSCLVKLEAHFGLPTPATESDFGLCLPLGEAALPAAQCGADELAEEVGPSKSYSEAFHALQTRVRAKYGDGSAAAGKPLLSASAVVAAVAASNMVAGAAAAAASSLSSSTPSAGGAPGRLLRERVERRYEVVSLESLESGAGVPLISARGATITVASSGSFSLKDTAGAAEEATSRQGPQGAAALQAAYRSGSGPSGYNKDGAAGGAASGQQQRLEGTAAAARNVVVASAHEHEAPAAIGHGDLMSPLQPPASSCASDAPQAAEELQLPAAPPGLASAGAPEHSGAANEAAAQPPEQQRKKTAEELVAEHLGASSLDAAAAAMAPKVAAASPPAATTTEALSAAASAAQQAAVLLTPPADWSLQTAGRTPATAADVHTEAHLPSINATFDRMFKLLTPDLALKGSSKPLMPPPPALASAVGSSVGVTLHATTTVSATAKAAPSSLPSIAVPAHRMEGHLPGSLVQPPPTGDRYSGAAAGASTGAAVAAANGGRAAPAVARTAALAPLSLVALAEALGCPQSYLTIRH